MSESSLAFPQHHGKPLAHSSALDEPPEIDRKVNCSCRETFRYIFLSVLFVSTVSFITCAAQGCLSDSPDKVAAMICAELCPKIRWDVTYVGLIIGAVGTLLSYLP